MSAISRLRLLHLSVIMDAYVVKPLFFVLTFESFVVVGADRMGRIVALAPGYHDGRSYSDTSWYCDGSSGLRLAVSQCVACRMTLATSICGIDALLKLVTLGCPVVNFEDYHARYHFILGEAHGLRNSSNIRAQLRDKPSEELIHLSISLLSMRYSASSFSLSRIPLMGSSSSMYGLAMLRPSLSLSVSASALRPLGISTISWLHDLSGVEASRSWP